MTRAPGLPDVVRSEWAKLRSLRSTAVVLALAAALALGLAALLAVVVGATWDGATPEERAAHDPLDLGRIGGLGVLVLTVLGVTAATSEAATLRTTLVATPRRGRVLAAKALVVAATTSVAGAACVLGGFLLTQALLDGAGLPTASLADGQVRRTVLTDALLAPLLPLAGLALGVVLRSAAGAVGALLALVLLPGVLGAVLPRWWDEHVVALFPAEASEALATGPPGGLGELPAALAVAGWAAALLGAAWLALERRDV